MGRLLLLLLLLASLAFAAALWLRGGDTPRVAPTSIPTSERQAVPRSSPGRVTSLEAPDAADERLTPRPSRERTSSTRRGRPLPDAPPTVDAPRGALVVEGLVDVDAEIDTLPADAEVRLALIREEGDPDAVYHRASLAGDGRFVCALPEWRALSAGERRRRVIEVRFTAATLTHVAETYAPPDADENRLEVELYAEALLAGVTARLVDVSGDPVAGVEVDGVLWAPGSGMQDTCSATSASDGRFALDSWSPGSFTVHAGHLEHGSVTTTVELAGERIDLGDLVLRPRGVLAGRVATPDGFGLPDVAVVAQAGEDGEELWVRTDTSGRFRFADLPRTAHRVGLAELGTLGPAVRSFVPDDSSIDLRLRRPVAAFRVVEPTGLGIDEVRWSFVRQGGAPDERNLADEQWLTDEGDTLVVAFPRAGDYALSASFEGDPDLVAFIPFTAEVGTLRRDVHLRPAQGTPVTFSVLDPTGAALDAWRVRYQGIERSAEAGWVSASEPTVELPPGTWSLYARPPRSSRWAPIRGTITISDGNERAHSIRLTERAGYIEFDADPEGPGTLSLSVREIGDRGSRHSVSIHRTEEGGRVWRTQYGLAAGRYTYRLRTKDGSKHEGAVTVRAGETARLELGGS